MPTESIARPMPISFGAREKANARQPIKPTTASQAGNIRCLVAVFKADKLVIE